jgi:hypothetical protein
VVDSGSDPFFAFFLLTVSLGAFESFGDFVPFGAFVVDDGDFVVAPLPPFPVGDFVVTGAGEGVTIPLVDADGALFTGADEGGNTPLVGTLFLLDFLLEGFFTGGATGAVLVESTQR